MEEVQRRKRFDKEYKVSTVKMLLEGKESLSSLAKDIGINPNTLRNWKNAYMSDQEHSFPGKGHQKPEDAELTRLRKENAKLIQQRDFLKKAVVFFTQHEK
jgi:transposase-like protein